MTYGNSAKHYQDNPDYYRERNKRRRLENQTRIREYKASHPCTDCGKFYPSFVMDFDHLRDKVQMVSRLTRTTTWPRILEEIQKCDLVCANCHRIRTYQRGRAD